MPKWYHVSLVVRNKYSLTKKHTSFVSMQKSPFMKKVYTWHQNSFTYIATCLATRNWISIAEVETSTFPDTLRPVPAYVCNTKYNCNLSRNMQKLNSAFVWHIFDISVGRSGEKAEIFKNVWTEWMIFIPISMQLWYDDTRRIFTSSGRF